MNDPSSTLGSQTAQVLGAVGAIFALLFWRGSAFGATLSAVGKIRRLSLRIPLTRRLQHLYWYNILRLCLFGVFAACLLACLLVMYKLMAYRAVISGPLPTDPGLVRIVVGRSLALSELTVQLSLAASGLLFLEWLIDGVCQYQDLEASLSVVNIRGRVERPELASFRLESYPDLLTLWQDRAGYCIEALETRLLKCDMNLPRVRENLGDSNISWEDFSSLVCVFRFIALTQSDYDQKNSIGSV